MVIKIKKSSIISIFIMYYILMDSVFPFSDDSYMQPFFYWTKFLIAMLVIGYAILRRKKTNTDELRQMRLISTRLRPIMVFPWIMMILYSFIIWAVQHPDMPYITRGISNFISCVVPILLGFALIDIFGKQIVKSAIIAICLMTITNYAMGIIVNGTGFIVQLFNIFQNEYIILKYKELHEIAFISGLFLIYYILKKNYKLNKVWIILTVACFFSAWKRIGILAIIIALLFYLFLRQLNRKSKEFNIIVCGVFGSVLSLLFVAFALSEELTIVMDELGINMMGRDVLYGYFKKFCDFSITYVGHGIGFVSRQFTYASREDLGTMYLLKQGLHSDFLSMYIEIGMVAFCLWLFYQLILIPKKIYKYFGIESAMYCFTLIIYNFVVYTTDNTLRYFAYQTVIIILICDFCYDGKCKIQNKHL